MVNIYVYVEVERSIDALKNPDKEFILFKCGKTKYKEGTRIKKIESTTGTPESGRVVWMWYECPLTEKQIHNLLYHLNTDDYAGKEWFVFSPQYLTLEVAIEELKDSLDQITGKRDFLKQAIEKGPKRKNPVPNYLEMGRKEMDNPFYLGSFKEKLYKKDIKRRIRIIRAKLKLASTR